MQDARANLEAMIAASRRAGAKVLLAGILIPPNYGPKYSEGFARMYQQLSREQKLPLLPFLLDGVALDPRLMQEDGMHPRAEGQPRVLDNVWQYLRPPAGAVRQ